MLSKASKITLPAQATECPVCRSKRFRLTKGTVVCTNCDHVVSTTPKPKYGNKKQTYGNYNYDSMLEARYAQELDLRVKAKDIKSWERQVSIPLEAYGKLICKYHIDFVLIHNDGHKEYLEIKGFETPVWRMKWKLLEAKLAAEEPSSVATIAR